jgi:ribosome recycling factor
MADETSIDDVLTDVTIRMEKSLQVFQHDLDSLRTGRASTALVENIDVDYYGTSMPLNQLATITAPEARLLVIQPYDRGALMAIEKEIQKSDLGLTPNNDGTIIRLSIPPLTEERRKDLVKQLKRKLEDGHVAVRNIRRDGVEHIRALEKEKQVSEDESRRAQERLQKITDEHIAKSDSVSTKKEAELMEI